MDETLRQRIQGFQTFPGARKIGLPFKAAVEAYLEVKYQARVKDGLTKADIFREDRDLYRAINNYKCQVGLWPIDIPSERDLVDQRLATFFKEGPSALDARSRTAVQRKGRRLAATLR